MHQKLPGIANTVLVLSVSSAITERHSWNEGESPCACALQLLGSNLLFAFCKEATKK